jgi:glycosyltransferase involved in cell wall biosynthesis
LIRQAQAILHEGRDVIGHSTTQGHDQSMNQIVINGRFLSRQHTGVDRFAIESIRALDELLVANDPALRRMSFEIVAPKQARAPTGLRRIEFRQVGRLQGHLWEQLELMRALKGRRLLNLCNTGPLLVRRQAVVIHDAATVRVPDAYTPAFRLSYRLLMPALGRRADSVMTVSDFSRRELDACWGIAADGVDVVAEGGEHLLREPADTTVLERHGLRPDAYLLAVGSMAPHKNLLALLRAVSFPSELPIDLVIAGGSNSRIFSGVSTSRFRPACIVSAISVIESFARSTSRHWLLSFRHAMKGSVCHPWRPWPAVVRWCLPRQPPCRRSAATLR